MVGQDVDGTESVVDPAGRARATRVGWLALVGYSIATSVALLVVVAILLAVDEDQKNGYCESVDHPGSCWDSGTALPTVSGLVLVTVGSWGIAASVGLLKRRTWARRSILATSSVLAAIASAVVVAAALSGELAAAFPLGVLGGLFIAIYVLAARAPTNPTQ